MEIKVLATGSKGNAIYISDGETPLLLDCGLTINQLKKALNFKLSEIQGVLVTHAHGDHIRGASYLMGMGIDVYMSQEAADSYFDTDENWNFHRLHIVYPGENFEIGSWDIVPFGAEHDIPTVGYLLVSRKGNTVVAKAKEYEPKVVYLTDSAYCKYKFPWPDYILLAVNYDDEIAKGSPDWKIKRIMRSHMSLDTAREFIRVNKSPALREVHLLHLSDSNSNAELFKEEIQKVAGVPVYVG